MDYIRRTAFISGRFSQIKETQNDITIAETKSINKAAEKLYVSQPSLTSAVQELEKELGITLFYRSGRGVTLTNDGAEFLLYARQLYGQYEGIMERYGKNGSLKKKFGVSAQHYSFAVKAFVDMAKEFDMSKYEFAIRETRTAEERAWRSCCGQRDWSSAI